jgi:hypothetical protein
VGVEEQERDEDDPGEAATRFATKGAGWSGRDKDEDDEMTADLLRSGLRPEALTSSYAVIVAGQRDRTAVI